MPYRPDRQLVSVQAARAILDVHGEPVSRTERVALDVAAGRVLAGNLAAGRDVPPFARSMMDGYAVRARDTDGASADHPVTLHLAGAVYSGHAPTAEVGAGQCMTIATGAPIPPGADAVVVVEDSTRHGDLVAIGRSVAPLQHVGRAGSDLAAGEIAAVEGTVLTPARIGVAAALGLDTLEVFARPRVAILSTGDEIVAPGASPGPAQIFDSNTAALSAAVRLHGGEAVVAPRTGDDPEALDGAFARCLDEDLVLFSGGTSVGERDYLLDIIAARGPVHFEGLLLKPGRPTVFATVAGRPVFGMPGNPVSCLTNMYLLVAPLLRRMARLPPAATCRVVAALRDQVRSPAGRHQIYPVRLERSEAVPVFKGSGEITSLAHADGYFEIEAGVERVEAGTAVEVTLF